MKFSIIIPVYNVEPYLRECLDSVLQQSFADWEAICVNDGSTDNSAAILEEYAVKDGRIKVVNQSNAGTATARNTGMRIARGDYLVFLDSDDWLESHSLQTIAEKLKGEEVLCFSGRRFIEYTRKYHAPDALPEKLYESGMAYYNENALLPRDFAFVCVVLRAYQRRFLLEYGLFFDDDITYEDNLWVPLTLFHAHTVRVISDPLYVYRIRQGSKMQEVSLTRKKDKLKVANRLAAFFTTQEGFEKRIVYQAITHHYQSVFVNASKGEKKELKGLCDWRLYRKVSQTKIRHIVNFIKYKFSFLFIVG